MLCMQNGLNISECEVICSKSSYWAAKCPKLFQWNVCGNELILPFSIVWPQIINKTGTSTWCFVCNVFAYLSCFSNEKEGTTSGMNNCGSSNRHDAFTSTKESAQIYACEFKFIFTQNKNIWTFYFHENGNILQGLSDLLYCSFFIKRICTIKRSYTTNHQSYYNLSLLTETSLCFFFFEDWSFALLIWLLTWSCSWEKKAWEERRALSFPSSWNRGTPC